MKQTRAGFIRKPDLEINGELIAEFETDIKQWPAHVGELYISGNWFSVIDARRLRDFLNEILPP